MSLVDPAFESNVITLLKGIYDNVGKLPYTSIAGTFYQNTDESVGVEILSNTTTYELFINSITAGSVLFTTDGDSDLRSTLIFLGPAAHPTCSFTITNDGSGPAAIIVDSFNAAGARDPRGFGGLDGASPISFELRFYTPV